MQFRTSRTFIGIGWMTISGLNFVAVAAIVKHIGPGMPPAQGALLRYLFGLVFVLPMLAPIMRAGLDRRSMILFGWRGLAHSGGVILWFFAMTKIAITEGHCHGLFDTGLRIDRRGHVSWRNAGVPADSGCSCSIDRGFDRSAARDQGGFARPFGDAWPRRFSLPPHIYWQNGFRTAWTLQSLSACCRSQCRWPCCRSRPRSGFRRLLNSCCFCSWSRSFATVGHYTMTLAFRNAPASTTQPALFLQIVWASLLGTFVFAEPTDVWVLTGGTVIFASVSFIAWREATVALRRRSPRV